ncbi:hypothetical protein ACFSVK_19350 [Azorhizophilus paspali]|uniref:Uncharacterized protein n=1 Tax=Azorhizophilus paspali TaxID=69963 RepID=A0ABV6SIA8_AZOPA
MIPILTDHTLTLGDYSEDLPRLAKPARVHIWSVPPEYRASGYFVSVQAAGQPLELPACDANDAKPLATLELPADAGANIDAARAERLAMANAEADRLLAGLSASYPEREVQSWDQQIKEAELFTVDNQAPMPLLDALATARGIERGLLAQKVREKAGAFSVAAGTILGARQRIEDLLEAADTLEAVLAVPVLAEVQVGLVVDG